MPKNFAFFQKPLDKFFYKFDNLEINRQEIFPASFKNIENREGFFNRASNIGNFPPRFCVYKRASSLFTGIEGLKHNQSLTAICDDKPIISIFRIFLRKVIEKIYRAVFGKMRNF